MHQVHLSHKGDEWVAKSGDKVIAKHKVKTEAIKRTAKAAKAMGHPVSVRIHKLDGKIHREHTYPRSADPRGRG